MCLKLKDSPGDYVCEMKGSNVTEETEERKYEHSIMNDQYYM